MTREHNRSRWPVGLGLLGVCLLVVMATLSLRHGSVAKAAPSDDTEVLLPIIFTQAPKLAIDPISLTQCETNDWTVSWNDAGVETYTLQESQSEDFDSVQEYFTVLTSQAISHAPSADNIYYYRVRANVPSGEEQWSETQTAQGNFLDDFSNEESGWAVEDLGIAAAGYIDNQYFIKSRSSQGLLYSALAPDAARSDYVVEADLSYAPGSASDGLYALVFGAKANQLSYYFVAVYPDRARWRLYYYDASLPLNQRLRRMAEQDPSPHVNPGSQVNHVKVWRIGDQIQIEMNGAPVGTFTDAAQTGPLFAGAMMTPNPANELAELRVDNFALSYCGSLTGLMALESATEATPQTFELPPMDIGTGAALFDWD